MASSATPYGLKAVNLIGGQPLRWFHPSDKDSVRLMVLISSMGLL